MRPVNRFDSCVNGAIKTCFLTKNHSAGEEAHFIILAVPIFSSLNTRMLTSICQVKRTYLIIFYRKYFYQKLTDILLSSHILLRISVFKNFYLHRVFLFKIHLVYLELRLQQTPDEKLFLFLNSVVLIKDCFRKSGIDEFFIFHYSSFRHIYETLSFFWF